MFMFTLKLFIYFAYGHITYPNYSYLSIHHLPIYFRINYNNCHVLSVCYVLYILQMICNPHKVPVK